MIIARLSTTTRIPVRLLDPTGLPVTGITSANILGGVVSVVSPSGVVSDVAVSGANFFEIHATKAPGLYHFQVPGANLATVGPTQFSLQPATANQFQGVIASFLVESLSADINTVRKIQTNRWIVSANQLIIFDDDRTTPLFTFNLFNQGGHPAMAQIFQRVPTP